MVFASLLLRLTHAQCTSCLHPNTTQNTNNRHPSVPQPASQPANRFLSSALSSCKSKKVGSSSRVGGSPEQKGCPPKMGGWVPPVSVVCDGVSLSAADQSKHSPANPSITPSIFLVHSFIHALDRP
mmetsp:Transcript_26940/g.67091  ORF Transcript_26940/g.67091 Transcript_26940/m.67091 type:complete len:126 (+) Transcript_26940:417-794(+)